MLIDSSEPVGGAGPAGRETWLDRFWSQLGSAEEGLLVCMWAGWVLEAAHGRVLRACVWFAPFSA